ncbi:hypothetical protein GJV44_00364 [Candidatus Vallotia cooleyia]|nr:hypothetical protein GJV44_00364 [Candidatus Vallotia cooleyia]
MQRLIKPIPAFYNEPMARIAKLLTNNNCFHRVFSLIAALKLIRVQSSSHRNGNISSEAARAPLHIAKQLPAVEALYAT